MNINETIDQYLSLEEKIGEYFGVELYEAVQDMREVKWYWEEGSELSWIEDDEEYSAEIYGTSVWEKEDLTLFTLYSDFGGKYHAIVKNSNKDETVWE